MRQRNYITVVDGTNPYDHINPKKPGKQVLVSTEGRVLKVVTVTGEGNADQSYKEFTSIKKLVARTEAKGLLRAGAKFEGEMDDFPDYDFQDAMFMVAKAKSMFEALPSQARKEFNNNPAEFMQFANNPNNQEKMIKMGLAKALDGFDAKGNKIVDTKSDKFKEERNAGKPAEKAAEKAANKV